MPPVSGLKRLFSANLVLCLSFALTSCGGNLVDSASATAAKSIPTPVSILLPNSKIASADPAADSMAQAAALNKAELTKAAEKQSTSLVKQSNVQAQVGSTLVPIYRFFNTRSGDHLFTANVAERNAVLANLPDYIAEGVGGVGFQAYSTAGTGLLPVYRFFKASNGEHFYTISESEKNFILNNLPQYVPEGIAYFASQTTGANYIPVHRFYTSSFGGLHFFTTNEAEKAAIIADFHKYQYTYEGIAYYIEPLNAACQLTAITPPISNPFTNLVGTYATACEYQGESFGQPYSRNTVVTVSNPVGLDKVDLKLRSKTYFGSATCVASFADNDIEATGTATYLSQTKNITQGTKTGIGQVVEVVINSVTIYLNNWGWELPADAVGSKSKFAYLFDEGKLYSTNGTRSCDEVGQKFAVPASPQN